jgi:hypothetical protein
MAEKYLKFDDTSKAMKEQEATTTSSGTGDAGKIVALNTDGKLHTSLLPTGIGADTTVLPAYENLTAGNFVNIFSDTGTPKVRKADATSISKMAHGFVLDSVNQGSNATVYFEGSNTQLSSLTPGATYFLSATAGAVTTTPPTTSGYIVQAVGVAVNTTTINVEFEQPIVRA